jgi:glycosyltransferase involved in cell wall biosynthesis
MFSDSVPSMIVQLVNAVERALSKRADRIIASGDLLGKRMAKISGRDVTVIQNTVSEKFGAGVVRKLPKQLTLGYVGGLLDDRNLRELVWAFKAFHREHPDSKLIIAGWGPLSEFIQEEAADSNAGIEFRGKVEYEFVPYLLSELTISIVFVGKRVRNNHYATPNKLFESIAMGVPALVSNLGQLKLIAQKSEFGIAVNSWDIDALVSAFDDIYKKQSQFDRMGEAARTKFRAEFSWEKIERKLHELYRGMFYTQYNPRIDK